MSFITDKQTLDDLNIPGKYRQGSVFSLFNRVVTAGGERKLEELFRQPLTDYKEINERTGTLKYFADYPLQFPFVKDEFHIMEEYLSGSLKNSRAGSFIYLLWKKLTASLLKDEAYSELHHQLLTTISLLNQFASFITAIPAYNKESNFFQRLDEINLMFNDNGSLSWIRKMKHREKLSVIETANYDYRLRDMLADEMDIILNAIYELDVNIAVGSVAKTHGFSFANVLPKEKNILNAVDLKHPCLANAVGNDISITENKHIVFLTGANMAGKSTFMKSLGIAVYLAHIGFPVAAQEFSLSVKDGLYTSINVSDDLGLGYSHFYSEVMRVKKIALEIERPLSLYIIFDELFKGTNVKDAHEATLTITTALTEKQHCFFVISTHITEAGKQLQSISNRLLFVYFPSLINGNVPEYTYRLQPGISDDRHGMMIIKKEGILELIKT